MTKVNVFHLVICLDLLSFIPTCYPVEDTTEKVIGPLDYENIPSEEFWGTEPRRLINKYYSKHHDVVTDRFTIDTGIHTEAICRCWKSKKFPFCDNSHKYHNKFHKDNVGPLIIDGNTFPDYVLDKYTLPTPNRSITYPTPSTMSDSQVDKAIDKYVKENEYSQDSDENSTCTIDKNDFFERLRKWPPGLGPQTAKFGWS
ncbi:hypothetical protein M8J75_006755 [Diaphorina citri]|nr:hypothetical protein M8J75_006755 [Diaphorina citri]